MHHFKENKKTIISCNISNSIGSVSVIFKEEIYLPVSKDEKK